MHSQPCSSALRAKPVLHAVLLAVLPAFSHGADTAASVSSAQEAAQLLAQGRCRAGGEKLNIGLAERDPEAYFVAGFMYARGVCVNADVSRGVPLLEVAAKSGWMEAARELTLIHGSGRGVPQSYAEAGRWAVAMLDIMALRAGSAQASQVPTVNGALPIDSAQGYGYAVTVHELAGDRVRSFLADGRFQPPMPMRVKVHVTVKLPGPLIDVDLSGVERLRDGTGSRPPGQTGEARLVEGIRAVYERAMKELPAAPGVSGNVAIGQPYTVTIR
jgi:hypothetical protein